MPPRSPLEQVSSNYFARALLQQRIARAPVGRGRRDRPKPGQDRNALYWTLAVAVLCSSCAGPIDRPDGAQVNDPNNAAHVLVHEGRERAYLLHLPARAVSQESVPLVISLHDAGADAATHRRQTGFDALAELSGFAVAYPQGWRRTPRRPAGWNAGDCCGDASKEDVDDVGFIRRVIEDITTSNAPVDPHRLYVVGIGNGAMLAHRIAQELPTIVTAVAAVGGTPTRDDFTTAAPIPLLQMHSVDDPLAPYDGGRASLPGLRETVQQAGVVRTLRRWTHANECATYPTIGRDVFGALGTVTAGQQASFYYHAECRNRKEIALWRLDGFGHAWPGGWDIDAEGVTTKRNDIIEARREIWQWLSRWRRTTD